MISSLARAAAKRALMAGSPDYFSWHPDARERFRATAEGKARQRMDQVLLKQVLGIEGFAADAQAVWSELSLEQLNEINPADLLTRGVGEDFVFLNECLDEGVSLLDFETLYDYDHDDFLFQEKWRYKDLTDYVSPGYFPLYQPRWIRLLMGDELVYGNLYSMAGYVISRVEEDGDHRLDELIPSSYVEGPNHGKQKDGGVQWDYQLDAGGQAPQLEELRRRWWRYQQDAELTLQKELVAAPPCAYILHDESPVPGETMVNLVISNETAMRRVRWKTLLTDLRADEGEREDVERLIEREVDSALKFIADQYQDVTKNYVPPDIAPGKERKLVISDRALDDLQWLSRDDIDDD